MKIDYYKKKTYKRPYRQFDITEILRQIQDGTYRNEVEKVERLQHRRKRMRQNMKLPDLLSPALSRNGGVTV